MKFARFLLVPTLVVSMASLSGCSTAPLKPVEKEAELGYGTAGQSRTASPPPVFKGITVLTSQLGMNRQPTDLGFTDRSFNPCSYGFSDSCNNQYLTVVHFQLLCRNSEGTVSSVPVGLTPIFHPQILWSLAGQSGGTATDRNGYGRLSVISQRPLRGHRLVLRKGANYVGVTVGEVTKLVLPKNWCG